MTRARLLAALVATALVGGAQPAAACGGCFIQSASGTPTVVTAHRMAVSIGTMSTVLWDQFEYAGDPEDFVWVLPIADGESVNVELADNAFFLALQQNTQITLSGPQRFTGGGGGGGGGLGCGAASAAAGGEFDSAGPMQPPVEVFHEGTVGPYETATIGSEDPMALREWLSDRGYAVPEDLEPIIGYYVEQGMDFVALRLSPGESVNRMQPVRVSTRGMNVSFPLRMVAAGVGDFVALELFVIAEGRYEAANFPNGEVAREEIVYDWAVDQYNYDELAEEVIQQEAGRTWLTEFSAPVSEAAMRGFTTTDDDGVQHFAADDWTVAIDSIREPTVTRMRANLPAQALSEDLVLAASIAGALPGQINVTQDVNWTTASVGGALGERGEETAMASLPLWPFAVLGVFAAGFVRRRFR